MLSVQLLGGAKNSTDSLPSESKMPWNIPPHPPKKEGITDYSLSVINDNIQTPTAIG